MELKPNIRLQSVGLSSDHGLSDTIAFYMGDNTPDRRQYIIDNLEVDAEVVQ